MTSFFEENALEIFESSVALSNQAIYWISKDGRLLFANENALNGLGYTLEQIQKLYVWDVDAIVDTKEKYLSAMLDFKVNESRKIENAIESKHRRKNGEIFPVEIVSKFIEVNGDEYLISYARDITARLKRIEDINFYFNLINSSLDLIFLVDHETEYVSFANETACKTLGYSLEEFKKMKVTEFRKPLEEIKSIEIPEVFKKIEKKENMTTFGLYYTKDGKQIPVETSLHFKEYHGKNYVVAISRDIRDRMEIESQKEDLNKKLKEYNETLKDEIEKAKSDLLEYENIMRKQSRMAAMGEMIENIAHQWRQPLSAVSVLSTGMIIQNSSKLLDKEKLDEGLNKINDHIQYLSKTIDDFRNFFKPTKEKNYFKIEELIKDTISLTEAKYDMNIYFILDIHRNEKIYSYESELLQVLLNVVNNAVYELEKVKHRKCIVFETSEDENYFILKIKDNAGGVSKKIIDRVFEPYFTTKHSYHGTGIGLYMSKNILKHMNGEIDIENVEIEYDSKKYMGACFEIKIPL